MGSVLTMEQGALLQPPLPIHEYSLHAEPDFHDNFSGHAPPNSYAVGGAVDNRRHGPMSQPTAPSFAFAASHHPSGTRFVSDRGVASEASTNFHGASHFTDSSSTSISASPAATASSVPYTSYATNHYTSTPGLAGSVQLPQAFSPGFPPGTRVPSILDGATPGALPLPHRSDILAAPGLGDRDAYTIVATPPIGRSQLPASHPSFGPYSETPRTTFTSVHHGLTSTYQAPMASTSPYSASQNESHNFPWPELECVLELTCEGQLVTPDIHAKVEKGFFQASNDRKWTCYRRNYFSVACHFELFPNISNGRMYLKRNNTQEQIQAMGIRLSAAVDGTNGKTIELVQHTPKRDQGPKTKIEITKLSPYTPTGRNNHSVSPRGVYQLPIDTFHATGNATGPYLPLQNTNDDDNSSSSAQTSHVSSNYGGYGSATSQLQAPGQNTNHTFERVQFKSATANNGKRRASQQYFHLIVELFADVRKDGADRPVWVKVAQRTSEKIVVRGRSPSHYQNEGQNGQTGRGNASGGGSYSGAPSQAYGSMNPGGFRSSTAGYGNGLGGGGTGYRSHYGMAHHSDGSGSSPGSVDEGAADLDHPGDVLMTDAERTNIQQNDEYQYFPGPIYEGVPQILPPLAKVEGNARYSTEPRQYAVKAEYSDAVPGAQWTANACSRFQGVDTSRGYFPLLSPDCS